MSGLDPDIRKMLERINDPRSRGIAELSVEEARRAHKKMAQWTAPSLQTVHCVEDHSCDGPNGPIAVRLYKPAPSNSATGTVVYLHGGGWVLGDFDDFDPMCRALALSSGCQIASVAYRLAPEHKHPAALQDCVAVLRWLERDADKMGINKTRLALAGDSAGANLAAVIYQSFWQLPLPNLRALVLIYPPSDLTLSSRSWREFGDGYILTHEAMTWFLMHSLPSNINASDPLVSPLFGPRIKGVESALVVTAGFDPLRDEGKEFAEKLSRDGVDISYWCYDSMVHGFINFGGKVPRANDAVTEIGAWIGARLGI